MTDKVECMATLKTNKDVQLEEVGLFINVKGGPKGFEYRLDNGPKSGMVLVPQLLRNVGAITLEGEKFAPMLKSHRLRMNVLTVLDLKELDIDLDGIGPAYGALHSCR